MSPTRIVPTLSCVLLLLASQASAQFSASLERVYPLSRNSSFESGTGGWNNRQISGAVLTRDWVPDGSFPREAFANLGAKFVRLRGTGLWGQNLVIRPNSRRHILNIHAFKKALSPSTVAGYACAAVTYYDAEWNELDSVAVPIGEKDPAKNRGIGDGMNFYSWGITVPIGAVNAILFVYNSANTEVNIDSFGLYEYTMTAKPGLARNIVQHPTFSRVIASDSGYAQGNGFEFWESERDWSKDFFGSLGSGTQAESTYQFLPILPGRTYTFSVLTSGPATTPSSAGIDFYDSSWQHISSDSTDLTNRYGIRKRIESPANTAYASVWAWCDVLDPGDYGLSIANGIYLQQQEPRVTSNTSIVAIDSALRGGRGGTLGASVSIVYSDADGLDLSSIDDQDAYFVSRTDPTTTYPVLVYFSQLGEDEKVLTVEYLARVPWYTDVGGIVIRPNQVKDKLGNFAPGKTISPIQLP
jgi:hypothetical protein